MKIKGQHVETKTNKVKKKCPKCKGTLLVTQKCSGMGAGDYITTIKCLGCPYTELSERTLASWLGK